MARWILDINMCLGPSVNHWKYSILYSEIEIYKRDGHYKNWFSYIVPIQNRQGDRVLLHFTTRWSPYGDRFLRPDTILISIIKQLYDWSFPSKFAVITYLFLYFWRVLKVVSKLFWWAVLALEGDCILDIR